ncbi:MAG: hypothetical protein FJ144_17995 [Deltaproteobacteria bacterium]|nr:hypothetical protein [Deltaproteobacteria bacterium]
MSDANKQFELRQLLKAYRKGLISDQLFEEQMREIQMGDGNGAGPVRAPERTYRAGKKTYSSERDMVVEFVDQFRAGEAFGGVVFALWSEVTQNACLRGGLRIVCEREAMHGRVLGARLSELGAQPTASIPESFREAARTRLGSPHVADEEKLADFLRRVPEGEAAVAPIREVIAQIEEDMETRSLLESITEDELATIRWFYATGKALGVAEASGAKPARSTSEMRA